MRLYQIQFDGQQEYVEAASMGDAVTIWREAQRDAWGPDWHGDEEPESCALLHEGDVLRSPRAALPIDRALKSSAVASQEKLDVR